VQAALEVETSTQLVGLRELKCWTVIAPTAHEMCRKYCGTVRRFLEQLFTLRDLILDDGLDMDPVSPLGGLESSNCTESLPWVTPGEKRQLARRVQPRRYWRGIQ
jgi:hypothetical protein